MSRLTLPFALALVGCFSPEYGNGHLHCPDEKCPIGYHCALDSTCWKNGTDPDVDLAPAAPDLLEPNPDASGMAVLEIDKPDFDYGIVDIGMVSSTILTITNSGDGTSPPLVTTEQGDNVFVVDTDACNGKPLAAGASCAISVKVTPVASGAKAYTITITAGAGGTVQSNLHATGRDPVTLTLNLAGTGTGSVSGMAISCSSSSCSAVYDRGTAVMLTATPDVSSTFDGWSGGGCGSSSPCTVTMDASQTIGAAFNIKQFTLSVDKYAYGASKGTVNASDSSLACAAACNSASMTYNYGSTVHLSAVGTAGASFLGWSGDCGGVKLPCTLTMTGPRKVTAAFGAAANYVFVSSAQYVPGSLGDVSVADADCNTLASAAGLPGSYVAWLSTSSTNAKARLGSARGWIRPDGKPFTDTVTGLTTNGQIFYPARLDENGVDVPPGTLVATGTFADGTVSTGQTCNDWTTTALSMTVGVPYAGPLTWTTGATENSGIQPFCDQLSSLYCFGTTFTTTLAINAGTGRVAFLTNGTFTTSSGLSAADSLCDTEAGAAAGTYRALLATTTSSAAGRFNLTGAPWVRTDGVLLADTASDFFAGGPYPWTGVFVAFDGTTYQGGKNVLLGAADLNSVAVNVGLPGKGQTNCFDWTTSTGPMMAFVPSFDSGESGSRFGSNPGGSGCGQAGRVICLHQ